MPLRSATEAAKRAASAARAAIEPALQAMMAQSAAMPPFWTFPHAMAQAGMRATSTLVEAPAPEIPLVRDMSVAGGGGPLRARMFDTLDADNRPAMVFFHGGGMVLCDIDTHDRVCRWLALASGARVISIDYRLAPQSKFPAQRDDALTAVRAIVAEAATWGIDPGRLSVGGDSAGGNLAAGVAHESAAGRAPPLAAQLLIYPWVQMDEITASMQAQKDTALPAFKWFRDAYAPTGANLSDPAISPLRATSFAGQPPCVLVTAGGDPLLDEDLAYETALLDAGVAVTRQHYPDQIHGFFSYSAVSSQALPAMRAAGEALGGLLGTR